MSVTEPPHGDLSEFTTRIGEIPLITAEKTVRAKSRDFFWYSPLLKEALDHVTAAAVVSPRGEAELLTVLGAAYATDTTLTPRGGGTGNYGQAMPLAGGVMLDLSRMTHVHEMTEGRVTCAPGVLMGDIDAQARAELAQELRMHPSTKETATIGGFLAGGSGGIGSIRWGMLAEPGNVLGIRVATLEAEPRLVDLTGADMAPVLHAYGTTGIIARVTMPLAPAPDWVEMLVAHADWEGCLTAGRTLCSMPGLWLKQLAAIEAPAPQRYFLRHARFVEEGEHLLCVLVAPNSADVFAAEAEALGGRVAYRSDRAAEADKAGLPHLHHLVWNHTTLRALRVEPEITYLQMGFPEGAEIAACLEIARRYPDEIINHVEFTTGREGPRLSSLPMVRFASPERLIALMAELEAMGCPVWDPHSYTLEEGGRRGVDPAQVALKRAWDPKGLLNPGKLIGWHEPDYAPDPARRYAYPGLQPRPRAEAAE